jgi:hypothetical protein
MGEWYLISPSPPFTLTYAHALLDAADFEHSSIWDPNPVYGLGGFGDPDE